MLTNVEKIVEICVLINIRLKKCGNKNTIHWFVNNYEMWMYGVVVVLSVIRLVLYLIWQLGWVSEETIDDKMSNFCNDKLISIVRV